MIASLLGWISSRSSREDTKNKFHWYDGYQIDAEPFAGPGGIAVTGRHNRVRSLASP